MFSFAHENVLGTSLDLQIETDTLQEAQVAEERALAEIDRLEQIFSRYNPASEFRNWQDHSDRTLPLSPELFHVLETCGVWKEISAGAFDPAGEAFLELWREAIPKNRIPSDEEIESLRARTAKPAWRLDSEKQSGMRLGSYPLSLNSVAKGFIIDTVCTVIMRCPGVRGMVVNIGGDLRVAGDKPRRVGITDPFQDAENAVPISIVSLHNAALATSGDGRRGFQIGSTWYSHIINPRTGRPATRFCSASVFAPDAMTADILATIFSIWLPQESLTLADGLPGVGCLLIEHSGKRHCSKAWTAPVATVNETKNRIH